MSLVDSISRYFGFTHDTQNKVVSKDVCGNCWGRENYQGKFYDAVKRQRIDVSGKDKHFGWIQDYANKNLSGISLRTSSEGLLFPKYKISYKEAK